MRSKLANAIPLLSYQREWVEDESKLKIAVKARQIGFSFAASLRAVLQCLKRKLTWVCLSAGERQSKLLMEKVGDHIKALNIAAQYIESSYMEGTLTKQLEVRFPNGSVIYGLPANPDTARGYSGNTTLDEFAFHQDAARVYSALYPTITRGYALEVISTPNGQSGKFFELAKAAGLVEGYAREPGCRWSARRVDIYDAVRQGFQVNPEELRAGVDDEETWQQEYCCTFLSDAANYLPLELILGCVSESATTEWAPPLVGELYLGIDIGRKRDLTVAWLFEKLGDVLWSRHLLTLRGTSFDAQEQAICDLLDLGVRRCAVDASGLGMMLAEHLVKRYGALVEPVQFTAQIKERLAPLVKQAFENRTVRIPDHREIRADLNAVKRFVTPAGNIRFDAEHTDRGHADRFWALALALNAAQQPGASLEDGMLLSAEREDDALPAPVEALF